ncbi:MAG: MotA/TolQ/ExbB proton channel family protein, partial [Deltaproteobacteria bacterium]
MGEIAKFYAEGGIWMYPITACSLFALWVSAQRIFMLYFRYDMNANHFMGQIQKLILTNNIDRAIKLCNATKHAALPRVIKAGLTRANKNETEISDAIEEATLE